MSRIISSSTLIILIYGLVFCEAVCLPGWFGLDCKYKCHCTPCDSNGQCTSKCDRGWFGQKCQYQDLATIDGAVVQTNPQSQSVSWLTDSDNKTCNTNQSLESIKVLWNQGYPLKWFRFQTKEDADDILELTFTTTDNQLLTCHNQQIYSVDAATQDYKCDVYKPIREVKISGPAVKTLCSLYINGGRNVALRQKTSQSGDLSWNNVVYSSSWAVDGNTDQILDHKSCSHTDTQVYITTANWTVTFDTPKTISRMVLYNRGDCCTERLSLFDLKLFDDNNNMCFDYTDATDPALVYNVLTPTTTVVTKAMISANHYFPIMTLCEVMAYGDCAPGCWGIDCKKTCPTTCKTSCHPETGTCRIPTCQNCG